MIPDADKGPGQTRGRLPPAAPSQAAENQPLRKTGRFPSLTQRELFERLGWFISIRWVAGSAALLLLLVARYAYRVDIAPYPPVITIGVLFLYNAVFLMLVTDAYRRRVVNRRFILGCANAQILCDLVTLAALLHFTGGVENPFLIFAVCPLVIASGLLPTGNAYAHAALCALLIHTVAWLEYAGLLSHVPLGAALGVPAYRNALAVTVLSAALSLLAFTTVFLGSTIAARLRRREQELEDAHAQLETLERSKSFLMRQTSHDLRAPLDTVIMMLRAIHDAARDGSPPVVLDLLARAEQRALGLRHLIDELHRYAVLRDSTAAMPMRVVDLRELVTQSVRVYTLMAEEKQLRLTGQTDEPAFVHGNPEVLTELVGNLVVNAIQYTPVGGEIYVVLQTLGSAARLEVRDSGIGIPPEATARVFDEFYRAANAKAFFRAGTGMGLPIVRRIVEAHRGTIEVCSELDRGTTFVVWLPLSGQPPER